jgi:serine/threonine protein kinase/tetratricopeptide (TPR) repeat protein
MTEESLFHEALTKPAGERAACLDAACAGLPQLRAAVEALLAAHQASGGPLAWSAVGSMATGEFVPQSAEGQPRPAVTTDYQPLFESGAVIGGRYTLVERIGEGGMGEVWVAKQTEPVKRKVAVKLIKAGMDSKAVLQRFDQERQALALMDHPNIARVLDGGMTVDLRPFFVMELVHGLPLNRFCDQARLAIRERLELFTLICQAVQHAHQKGIIHRDLKPSNILLTIIDGKPLPKIIDFGVAKATSGKLTDDTMSTGFGAVVGTLEYMAPEQAGFAGVDIDTRADIYSLGVILYELLTGLRPIDGKRLRKAALTEMVRILQEEEPSKPSTRLSTDESLPSLAALRQTEPRKLMSMLRGELDWVVMKCLEKQRDRRYETANGLARDLQRFLADEPVEARPPSAGYRIRKFVRRNKKPAIAASLVLAALVTGMAGTTWQSIRAEQARADEAGQRAAAEANERKANAAANGERLAKLDAQAKERLAVAAAGKEMTARLEEERQRQFSEAISRFVQDDFLALTSVEGQDRFGGEGKEALSKDTTLRELLDRAANKLRERKDLDPRIEAELCWIIGVNYRGAGDARKSIEFLERAVQLPERLLGRNAFDTLNAMNSLAVAYKAAGEYDLAVSLWEETFRLEEAKLGREHPDTLATMKNLARAYLAAGKYKVGVALQEEAFELHKRNLGLGDPQTIWAMSDLGLACQKTGKLDLALPLLEEAHTLAKAMFGPDHPSTLVRMADLGASYYATGKLEAAVGLLEQALERMTSKLGPEHPNTLACMQSLAHAYRDSGKMDQALPLAEMSVSHHKAVLGPDHPGTLVDMVNLSHTYLDSDKSDLALPLADEAVRRLKVKLGTDHPDTLVGMHALAIVYANTGKTDLALPLFQETIERMQRNDLGPDHPLTLRATHDFAKTYLIAGKLDAALPLFEETLAKLGPNDPLRPRLMSELAKAYLEARRLDAALPLAEEALRLQKARLGPEHTDTLDGMQILAAVNAEAGRFDQAFPLFEETLKLCRAKFGTDHLRALTAMHALAHAYAMARQFDAAMPLADEAYRRRKAMLGPEHADTLDSMHELAALHAEDGHFDVAIPLFEATLALREAKFGPEHPRTLACMASLGATYHKAGKLDLALPLLELAHKRATTALGPDHHLTLSCIYNLAHACRRAGRFDLAVPLFDETLRRGRAKLGPEHPNTLASMHDLAAAHRDAGHPEVALALFEETLKLRQARFGADDPHTLATLQDLAQVSWLTKRLDKSVSLFEELFHRQAAKCGRDHPDTLNAVANLGINYRDAGRLDEALPLLEEAYQASMSLPALAWVRIALLEAYAKAGESAKFARLLPDFLSEARATLSADSPALANTLSQVSLGLLELNEWSQAEPLLRECLAIREKREPDEWRTFCSKSMLGGALLGQKNYSEAELLLVTGYEGMKKREKSIPPFAGARIPEALKRLVRLYQATDRSDEAAKWQKELEAIMPAVQGPGKNP